MCLKRMAQRTSASPGKTGKQERFRNKMRYRRKHEHTMYRVEMLPRRRNDLALRRAVGERRERVLPTLREPNRLTLYCLPFWVSVKLLECTGARLL